MISYPAMIIPAPIFRFYSLPIPGFQQTSASGVSLVAQTGKNLPDNAGDPSLIPGSGRSPGGEKWSLTPAVLPAESYGQWSREGYSPWGCRVRHD